MNEATISVAKAPIHLGMPWVINSSDVFRFPVDSKFLLLVIHHLSYSQVFFLQVGKVVNIIRQTGPGIVGSLLFLA